MKHHSNGALKHDLLEELRSDFMNWRKVASQCAKTNSRIPPATEEQYKIVHGRILARCQNLANEELAPAARRHAALKLDELLRPWSSTKTLMDAPPSIVNDLVRNQSMLDERLGGKKRRLAPGQMGKLLLTAVFAAVGGIVLFALLQWASSDAVLSNLEPVQGFFSNITTYVGRMSFTERFAVAILASWLFGTWLLSRLPND